MDSIRQERIEQLLKDGQPVEALLCLEEGEGEIISPKLLEEAYLIQANIKGSSENDFEGEKKFIQIAMKIRKGELNVNDLITRANQQMDEKFEKWRHESVS